MPILFDPDINKWSVQCWWIWLGISFSYVYFQYVFKYTFCIFYIYFAIKTKTSGRIIYASFVIYDSFLLYSFWFKNRTKPQSYNGCCFYFSLKCSYVVLAVKWMARMHISYIFFIWRWNDSDNCYVTLLFSSFPLFWLGHLNWIWIK